MTTKTLKKFIHKKVAYYTDGGECLDLGSEGDFGHFAAMNFTLYSDPEGTKEIAPEAWPDDDDFYGKAANASEALIRRFGRYGWAAYD